MKTTTRLAAIGLAGLCACLTAGAQNIYRCGNSYSQAPCSGGQVIDVTDPPPQQPPAKGASAVERDLKAVSILEKDRLRQEAQAAPANIPVRTGEPATRQASDKPRKLEQFRAVAPAQPGDVKKKSTKKDRAHKQAHQQAHKQARKKAAQNKG